MAKLWYETRGNSSPDHKQKVYYFAHPRDHGLFESIAMEILHYQNCAVWYDTEPEAKYNAEEFGAQLAEMQLFVVPVTTRLLTQSCRALEFELALARREHIPVLPLMQESGLDELFNKKFGDVQYLDKNNTDPTAIPYEEKLEKFLNAVLVGDEEAERIRKAFAAYIFLSYRKKDRAHAQKLMRLIHKVDFCRDVAIWYDEFLTPSEDFTVNITKALDQCDLFSLAVTPNLLETGNYVMTTEYPMAVDSGKKILPFELIKTDRDELYQYFEGIADCVNPYDEVLMYGALFECLCSLKEKRNDAPSHLYDIGLAYLNGVDVERDNDRALGLITHAAEGEHLAALDKLVQMYREGLGVERSYKTAVDWQRRLVAVRERLYKQSGNADDAKGYFDVLWDLGNFINELGKTGEARAVYEKMEQISCEFVEKFDGTWPRRDLLISYEKLGEISVAMGNPTVAKEYYQKDLELCVAIVEESNTLEARRDLSISYDNLGEISAVMGDTSAAEVYYKKGLDIRNAIAEESFTFETRRDFWASYEKLGDLNKEMGDPVAAKEYYQKGLEIAAAIAEERDTFEARHDLSTSYNRLGAISAAMRDFDDAEEYYKKSLDIRAAIAVESDTLEARRALSISYEKLGNISEAMGSLSEAKEYYLKDLELAIAIAEESDALEARRDLSVSYNNLGAISEALDDLSGAKEYYKKCLAITTAIAKESDTLEARRDLSISYEKLGEISEALDDLYAAKEYYQRDFELVFAIAEESNTPEAQDDLAVAYYKLGTLDEHNPDRTMIKKALTIWKKLSRKHPDVPEYAERKADMKMLLRSSLLVKILSPFIK